MERRINHSWQLIIARGHARCPHHQDGRDFMRIDDMIHGRNAEKRRVNIWLFDRFRR